MKERLEDEARKLKHTKHILLTGTSTRLEKGRNTRSGKIVSRSNMLFNKDEATQRGGNHKKCREFISQNELFSVYDIVKKMLAKAYSYKQEKWMRGTIEEVVTVSSGTGNRHFEWFTRRVKGHMENIVAHARRQIIRARWRARTG